MLKNNIKKQTLTHKYLKEKKSLVTVANELNCSVGIILNRFKFYNIKTRTLSEGRKCIKTQPGTIHGESNKKHYCIESNCNNEISYKNYKLGNGRCKKCNGKIFKISRLDKNNPNYKHGLTNNTNCIDCGNKIAINRQRCRKCSSEFYIKFNHWNYISELNRNYPYKFNKELKNQIRKRDNYNCQNLECNKIQKETDRALSVHHIDYDKENLNPDNLISLCINCHMKTNFNRDYWYAYYSYINKRDK